MLLQIVFLLVFFGTVSGLVGWFFYSKKTLLRHHSKNTLVLENQIARHEFQINFRKENVNRYDFLLFNLKETLIVQPEIKTI